MSILNKQLRAIEGNDPPQSVQLPIEKRKQLALNHILNISTHKPELSIVRMEGIRQEIRSIKQMLGRKKAFLGLPEPELPEDIQLPAIESGAEEAGKEDRRISNGE